MTTTTEYYYTYPDAVREFKQHRTTGDVADQATDREIDKDHDTGTLLAKERGASTVRVNALTREQYNKRARPQGNLMAHRDITIEAEPDETYDRGVDKHDPGVKPSQTYRPSARVSNDLVNEGHGFVSVKFSNPDLPEECRYCKGRLIPPDPTSRCEFETPTHETPLKVVIRAPKQYGVPVRTGPGAVTRVAGPGEVWGWAPLAAFKPAGQDVVVPVGSPRPSVETCECNGCTIAREGRRKPGGQWEHCGSPACKKAQTKEKNARAARRREARHRGLAVQVIEQHPAMTDKEIATRLDIPVIRVREARESYPLNT